MMSKNFLTKLYLSKVIKSKNKEEVLNDEESHRKQLKDKLIETIELKEFRVSDHIFKDSINASGIPVVNNEPKFILHSLPDSDNECKMNFGSLLTTGIPDALI